MEISNGLCLDLYEKLNEILDSRFRGNDEEEPVFHM